MAAIACRSCETAVPCYREITWQLIVKNCLIKEKEKATGQVVTQLAKWFYERRSVWMSLLIGHIGRQRMQETALLPGIGRMARRNGRFRFGLDACFWRSLQVGRQIFWTDIQTKSGENVFQFWIGAECRLGQRLPPTRRCLDGLGLPPSYQNGVGIRIRIRIAKDEPIWSRPGRFCCLSVLWLRAFISFTGRRRPSGWTIAQFRLTFGTCSKNFLGRYFRSAQKWTQVVVDFVEPFPQGLEHKGWIKTIFDYTRIVNEVGTRRVLLGLHWLTSGKDSFFFDWLQNYKRKIKCKKQIFILAWGHLHFSNCSSSELNTITSFSLIFIGSFWLVMTLTRLVIDESCKASLLTLIFPQLMIGESGNSSSLW